MKLLTRHTILILAILLPHIFIVAQGNLCINELMQSNVDFLMVEHDFPDSWVELYNGSDTRISVQNYRIGPTNVFSESYKISSIPEYIEPGGYLLLYCDKTTGVPYHYNFNLESGRGKLFLFDNNSHAIDSVSYDKMLAQNVAYGRTTDGGSDWQHELSATPGTANIGVGCDVILPEPIFSNEGHIMTGETETISISMPDSLPEDTRIFLTMDGSEPTWDSPSDTFFNLNINKSTVIRAKLLSHYAHPIRSTTHSYIYHPRATNLPIISIATDSIYLYSSEEGILSPDSTDGKPNYKYDWRRPANFEYFLTQDGTTVFNQSGEMAVSGGATRKYQQKSIKCYAKKRFGKKLFKGDFWRDKPGVDRVKSFILRAGGNNCMTSRIDDAFVQKMFGTHLDNVDYQAYEPIIVYVNGQYKGIFGMRERSNEDYVTSNYGIEFEEEDLEMGAARNYLRANISGTPLFNSFNTLYHRDDITYEELAEAIDTENFMNAFIAECYASNTDFPHNNVSMWRHKNEYSRWRWILKDLDFIGIRNYMWDSFKYMLGTSDVSDNEYELSNDQKNRTCCKLYEKMISFPEFRNHFIASYATYLGDFLRPDVCVPLIREMDEEIIDEIEPTFAAYGNMSTIKRHHSGIERLCNYVTARPSIVYQQMATYFSLGDVIPISILQDTLAETETNNIITMCNVPLRTGRFDGVWFTQFPLSLFSDAEDAAWTMTITHANGGTSFKTFNSSQIQPDITSCLPGDSIAFIATTANIANNITRHQDSHSIATIHDLTGKKQHNMQKGINIVLYTNGTSRKILY